MTEQNEVFDSPDEKLPPTWAEMRGQAELVIDRPDEQQIAVYVGDYGHLVLMVQDDSMGGPAYLPLDMSDAEKLISALQERLPEARELTAEWDAKYDAVEAAYAAGEVPKI